MFTNAVIIIVVSAVCTFTIFAISLTVFCQEIFAIRLTVFVRKQVFGETQEEISASEKRMVIYIFSRRESHVPSQSMVITQLVYHTQPSGGKDTAADSSCIILGGHKPSLFARSMLAIIVSIPPVY